MNPKYRKYFSMWLVLLVTFKICGVSLAPEFSQATERNRTCFTQEHSNVSLISCDYCVTCSLDSEEEDESNEFELACFYYDEFISRLRFRLESARLAYFSNIRTRFQLFILYRNLRN
jgi:hypothetical protein